MSTELVDLNIDEIVPYWRNPRRIPEEAVTAVAESIHRYGYLQPIVVDSANVIIIGHTRYAALRRLGVTDVPVRVEENLTPEQVKQLRLIDNKVGELTDWDFDALAEELSELDQDQIRAFFPEIGAPPSAALTGAVTPPPEPEAPMEVGLVCPSCYHSWEMSVTRDDLLTGKLEVKTDA